MSFLRLAPTVVPTVVVPVFVLGLLVSAGPAVLAQSSVESFGSARASALGHVRAALPGDAGPHVNPAVRGRYADGRASFFARQSYGLSALRYGTAHVSHPMSWGVASGGAATFGFEDYRESHLSISFARGWSPGTSRTVYTGLHVRYAHLQIEGFGNAGTLALDAGLSVDLVTSLQFGVMATNLSGAALTDDAALPQMLIAGLAYDAGDRVLFVLEAEKDVAFPLSVRGGVEVRPVEALALRVGSTARPTRFTAGMGVTLVGLHADVAAEQHPDLGWSPSASLSIAW